MMREETGDSDAAQYLDVAERNDLGTVIDRQTIRICCAASSNRTISRSHDQRQLGAGPGFRKLAAGTTQGHCVSPSQIIVQIRAVTAENEPKPVQQLIRELKSAGCRFSISEFGSEQRTLTLLEHLDTDFIRLQSNLTDNLTGDSAKQDQIRRVVDAAEPGGATIIAGEVADTSSLAVLWQCGVKLIAGAFLKEPSQVVGQ